MKGKRRNQGAGRGGGGASKTIDAKLWDPLTPANIRAGGGDPGMGRLIFRRSRRHRQNIENQKTPYIKAHTKVA